LLATLGGRIAAVDRLRLSFAFWSHTSTVSLAFGTKENERPQRSANFAPRYRCGRQDREYQSDL